MPAFEFTQPECFRAVDELVKSWTQKGEFVHHVKLRRDRGEQGIEYDVIFSVPEAAQPVPEQVAVVSFTVNKPREGDGVPRITYSLETHARKIPATVPIRKQWLQSTLRRKQMVAEATAGFSQSGRLPQPKAFVLGSYMAADAVANAAVDGVLDNVDRLNDARDNLEVAREVGERNARETVTQLEELLVSIFNDADADGNGCAEPRARGGGQRPIALAHAPHNMY